MMATVESLASAIRRWARRRAAHQAPLTCRHVALADEGSTPLGIPDLLAYGRINRSAVECSCEAGCQGDPAASPS